MEKNGNAPKTIDEYIARYPHDVAQILTQIRSVI